MRANKVCSLIPWLMSHADMLICLQWFELWRRHIDDAVEKNQRLQVYFFQGCVGKGVWVVRVSCSVIGVVCCMFCGGFVCRVWCRVTVIWCRQD